MLDPEHLLGSLIRSSLAGRRRGRGLPTQTKIAVGMGLLGVAIAAVEHLSEKQAPPPPVGPPVPPPIPPPPPPAAVDREREAVLLVRAMVAAAAADGVIDANERERIMRQIGGSGLTAEEQAFLEAELARPAALDALLADISSPQLAEQVYAASLLAIDLDHEHERAWLAKLARGLALDAEAVARVHRMFEIDAPDA